MWSFEIHPILFFILVGFLIIIIRWMIIKMNTSNIIEYHSNGKVRLVGMTRFNKRIGKFYLYNDHGNLICTFHYKGGDLFKEEHRNPYTKEIWKQVLSVKNQVHIQLDKAPLYDRSDFDIVLQAVKVNPANFQYAGKFLRNDHTIVFEAIKRNGLMLHFASDKMKSNSFIVLTSIHQNGFALKSASEGLKNDRDIVMEAVKQNGLALECASEGLKNDCDIVMEAVKQNGLALRVASEGLKNDRDIVMVAVKQNGYSLQYANSIFYQDKSMVVNSINNNPNGNFSNLNPVVLLSRYEYISVIFSQNKSTFREFSNFTKKIKLVHLVDRILSKLPLIGFLFYSQKTEELSFSNYSYGLVVDKAGWELIFGWALIVLLFTIPFYAEINERNFHWSFGFILYSVFSFSLQLMALFFLIGLIFTGFNLIMKKKLLIQLMNSK